MATRDTLKVKGNSITGDELLSYIINVTPELQGQVDLPVQGDKNNIPKIGEIIIYDIDDNYNYARLKIGDGVRTINDLEFLLDTQYILHNSMRFDKRKKWCIIVEKKEV